MDEDTQWLHSFLEGLLPGHSLTLWRGVTPLTGWWLVVCAKGAMEWQFTLRHETIVNRDQAGVMQGVSARSLIPQ